jgi:hypothetical protein
MPDANTGGRLWLLKERATFGDMIEMVATSDSGDSRYGNGQNGHSRMKVEELARLMYALEAIRESRQ